MSPPIVVLRDVTRTYGADVTALRDVSLSIARGELLAIVGPSGSGKSTLLNIIGTLDRPSTGEVAIDGLNLALCRDRDLSALRARRIGFVFQHFHLSASASALDNVADGLLYTGLPRRDRRQRAATALHKVGLGHRLDHLPHQLSGGEKQRTAIARALARRPLLLLADEPTGALDSIAGEGIVQLLLGLHREGTAVVVITHDSRARRTVRPAGLDARWTARRRRAECDAVSELEPAKLLAADVVRLAAYGLRARPLRVVLSALGIAIGIAAMIAVVGISTSSRAQLNQLLGELGTNLLSAGPGTSMLGKAATMPPESIVMVKRIEAVEAVSATGLLVNAKVYRTDRIPQQQSGGIAVFASRLDLPQTVSAHVAAGTWLNAATAQYPTVVLGARAATRLGIGRELIGQPIWLGRRWFTVTGILEPVSLVPALDLGALIGWPAAEHYLGFQGYITTLYVRTDPAAVEGVRSLLARTANPEQPKEIDVSRPSDALAAAAATDIAFTGLLLGLGAVALLVGGIGVANTMVISVLERRAEIGLRRSQGATRGHIRLQFFGEALLLAMLGGLSGLAMGFLVTALYARLQGWPLDIPAWAESGGLGTTLLIGSISGLYPAIRAARLPPTEALG